MELKYISKNNFHQHRYWFNIVKKMRHYVFYNTKFLPKSYLKSEKYGLDFRFTDIKNYPLGIQIIIYNKREMKYLRLFEIGKFDEAEI